MTAEQPVGRVPQVMNPLWIISLFLGISEVTVGVAATQSGGWIQGLLALFATLFPIGVAAAFFVILWRRPFVLYAPGDFSEHTTVTAYVEAMRGPYQPVTAVEEVARSAVESVLPWIAEDRPSAVKHAMQVVREDLARRTITVDVRYALGLPREEVPPISVPVDGHTTVGSFIRNVAVGAGHAVVPEKYGRRWVLTLGSENLTDIGASWAADHDREEDDRLLAEVGIPLGSSLSISIIHVPRFTIYGGEIVSQKQVIRTIDDLPKFSTREELQSHLSKCMIAELRSIGSSMGVVMPKRTKTQMIEAICSQAVDARLRRDLIPTAVND